MANKGKMGCAAAALIVVVALCLGGASLWNGYVGDLSEGAHYERDRAAAEAAGIPTHAAQLQGSLPPESENAAPLYAELMARSKVPAPGDTKENGNDAEALSKTTLPAPADFEAARAGIARRPGLLALIHKAALRPKCVFARSWDQPNPAAILFPEFATMRDAERRLTTESLLMAHDGHPLEAVKNETLGFAIARHTATDPTLISALVGFACDAITLGSLRKILYLSHGDPKVAAAVQEAVQKNWHPRSLAPAFKGEIALGQSNMDYIRAHPGDVAGIVDLGDGNGQGPSPGQKASYRLLSAGPLLNTNADYLLQTQRKVLETCDLPYSQAAATMQSLDKAIKHDVKLNHTLAHLVTPIFTMIPVQKAASQAQAEVTKAGAALLVWKAAHGAFPATLAEAMPRVPADPFDGKPLRYRREGAGFVLYSVGKDGTFNGGTPDKKSNSGDVAFRWPAPAYLQPEAETGR